MTGKQPKRAILAAGGTGGHMFPAQALARELIGHDWRIALITDRRGGGFGPDFPRVETHFISAGGVAGTNPVRRLQGFLRLGLGMLQARRLVRTLKSDVVVGFGGYASVPTVLAGAWQGLRVILHEQNAVLGRANRLLAPRAQIIATSFDRVDGIADVDRAKVHVTGNPVRPAIAALGQRPYVVPAQTDRLRLLVVGGSQGAAIFNDVVPKAICLLPEDLRRRIDICQQVRGPELERVAAEYRACGVTCETRAFFDNLPERLSVAHLVISRAGATTVAELAAAGRPSLVVPLPSAIDDHQPANARRLAEVGGGWLLPHSALTPETLAERLESLLANPALLARASSCAQAYARMNAARDLADLVCSIGADKNRGGSSCTGSGPGEVAA